METGLAGKGVLVTGGSGGIGAACVRAFRAEGARVVAHYHRGRDRAEAVGADAIVGGDLRDEAEVERVFAEAREALGRIDVCAAVAGCGRRKTSRCGSSHSSAGRRRSARTSPPRSSRRAPSCGRCERTGHGSLVLVGSTAGVVGEAGHADYATAKGALLTGLLLSLKNEIVRVAPLGRVNAVAPGWTESPMTRGHVDPDDVRRLSRTMALRKVARPEDVARQVVVLASDELSGHVTGQVVTIAGGMEGRTIHES